MSDHERRLREQLDEARFQNKVLTWIAAGFFLAWLVTLIYLR